MACGRMRTAPERIRVPQASVLTGLRQEPTGAHHAVPHVPGESGIWIMIFGDMMVFSLMFVAFMLGRREQTALFAMSRLHLNQTDGLVNTFLMLSSSWCVASAVHAVRAARQRAAGLYLRLALGCGLGFCAVKVLEYAEKFRAGIAINSNDFYMYYFVFTGIHLLHVLIGMGVLIFMLRIAAADVDAKRLGYLESGASFWHLVDLLWIALFALLYLLPGAGQS
jgi:nitric oxide reductase NorE protein